MINDNEPKKRATLKSNLDSCLLWCALAIFVFFLPPLARYHIIPRISPSAAYEELRSKAVYCYIEGKYDEARPLLESCLHIKEEPALRLLLGICHEETGNSMAALECYKKCRSSLYREGQPLPLDLEERMARLSRSDTKIPLR